MESPRYPRWGQSHARRSASDQALPIGDAAVTLGDVNGRSPILVSFAVYKVGDVNEALAAAGRGVDVRLVVETSEDDGGALKGLGAACSPHQTGPEGDPTRGSAGWWAGLAYTSTSPRSTDTGLSWFR